MMQQLPNPGVIITGTTWEPSISGFVPQTWEAVLRGSIDMAGEQYTRDNAIRDLRAGIAERGFVVVRRTDEEARPRWSMSSSTADDWYDFELSLWVEPVEVVEKRLAPKTANA